MILLALDTSATHGSVALAQGLSPAIQYSWDKKAAHSEVATVETQRILKDHGLTFKDLTHLSVNIGPGSFTGIRVGLNLIRTLGYSLSLPIAVFNSLQLLALKESKAGTSVLIATKAVQSFFYVAGYEVLAFHCKEKLSPQSLTLEELEKLAPDYTKVLIEGKTPGLEPYTEAKLQVEIIKNSPQSLRFFSWEDVKPLYIRASEAEEKLRRGLLKPL